MKQHQGKNDCSHCIPYRCIASAGPIYHVNKFCLLVATDLQAPCSCSFGVGQRLQTQNCPPDSLSLGHHSMPGALLMPCHNNKAKALPCLQKGRHLRCHTWRQTLVCHINSSTSDIESCLAQIVEAPVVALIGQLGPQT